MTNTEYQVKRNQLFTELAAARKAIDVLDAHQADQQDKCEHKLIDDPGSRFGEKCLDCGKFWPGAY